MKKIKEYANKWMFGDTELETIPDKAVAFVYLITDTETGKKYIGKKNFWSKRKLKKTDKRRTTIESDWKFYWSSSKTIQELIKQHGTDRFTREILVICNHEKYANYLEVKFQFKYNILEEPDNWYNDNINGNWYPANYTNIKEETSYSQNKTLD